ncbi:MAG: selenide, water dikinase SelD [Acidobacteria bacterium]|nr:selenide, water dikinase SelD [Acidobacteriota bacterium]
MRALPRVENESVLVGYETSDDAGVYRLSPECALVQTVDFFTPIVDDPFSFGAITAANALSDVYAMGGRPISALSIVCYPSKGDMDELEQILKGGAFKMSEARCPVIGGHSVNDDEIKFGYAVTGVVHPDRIWRNAGAKPGDVLLFTKRLGTGIIGTALKRGIVDTMKLADAMDSMLTLNAQAAEALEGLTVNACTDISGFGLIGHAREMAIGSGVTLEIEFASVPILPGTLKYVHEGAIPSGLNNNREFASGDIDSTRLHAGHADIETVFYDPQTSGGLLISMPDSDARVFEQRFTLAKRIGHVTVRGPKAIRIL